MKGMESQFNTCNKHRGITEVDRQSLTSWEAYHVCVSMTLLSLIVSSLVTFF